MIPQYYQKILAQILILTLVSIHIVKANFSQKNVVQLKENQTFILTNGFEEYRPQVIEENILQINATKDSDYLLLSAYNITDYSHNPTVLITPQLQMLNDLFHFINKPTIPSNITYTNCTLSYSQQCVINNQSTKVKEGDTFYLVFVGVGVNRHSYADINSLDRNQFENVNKFQIEVNGKNKMILFSPAQQKKLIFQLQDENLKSNLGFMMIGSVNVYFVHANGQLLGEDKQEKEEWNHESNQVIFKQNGQQVHQERLIFQSNLQQNRQFFFEFDLQQISSLPIGVQRNLELDIQQDYNNTQVIGLVVQFIAFTQSFRGQLLTSPIIATLISKSRSQNKTETETKHENRIVIRYWHPLFEYLNSEDKENDIHAHFKPPQHYQFFINFDIKEISSHPQQQVSSNLYYNTHNFSENKPDDTFIDTNIFKIDVNKIRKIAEQVKYFYGIYLILYTTQDSEEYHTFLINSNLQLEKEKQIDTIDNKNDNNDNKNDNNDNNNQNNNKNNDKNDDTVLILIVVVGLSFIIVSTLVYVKCISKNNSDLEEPQQLEEVGEDNDKQNDVEKGQSNDSSGNNSKKPQSTKSSTKTNGNHIQLLQDEDKSGLDYLDNHNSSTDRKSHNRMQSDLSSNALQQDKVPLREGKKPPQRKKNVKNHLRIEIDDPSHENKDKEAQQKQQQLKQMQQQALKQKQHANK